GGTQPGATVPDGSAFVESLDTQRFDGGLIGRASIGASRLLAIRLSGTRQEHDHGFGPVAESDRHHTWLAEASLTGASGRHTWVAGAAVQSDRYRARDVAGFDYTHTVPAVFAQDDFALSAAVTLSASARLDRHNVYGTLFSPRASALVRPGAWTVRASAGSGSYAPTPLVEETEAVGLSRVVPGTVLRAERAASASLDVGRTVGPCDVHATLFGSVIRDPVAVRAREGEGLVIANAPGPVRTRGAELVARLRWRELVATATATYTHSTEIDVETGRRREVPLTPRYAAGVVAAWERHGRSRVGLELYYTGRQPLDDNPYRAASRPYLVVGLLAEHRFGPARVFVNAENLGDARQTRHDRLVRPARGPDGRWTVDAWAPLEGRTVNGGVRLSF
ncbi:MAG TPA: TonB-dependent receptor, partial [Vicinamibacteria bacterium]|nr:TonB-dependent receptor [Vicinamibacteria bacterium]